MASPTSRPSIFDLDPLETGGVENRQGIRFQDHVAASFCLDMLSDTRLAQVWCENQDDITLLWINGPSTSVEFVQAKSNEPPQLWSVALLCAREGGKPGQSLLEKSLAHDRCEEAVRFRIVTTRPVMKELEILVLPIGSNDRIARITEEKALAEKVRSKIGEFRSGCGHDCAFWVHNATWDVRHDEQPVRDSNLLSLSRALDAHTAYLAPDQQHEVYARLVEMVADAAATDWHKGRDKKHILRQDLMDWLRSAIDAATHPAASGGDSAIRRKMKEAGLPDDTINSAVEERRHYREQVLGQHYLDMVDSRLVEGEVAAALQYLRSRLDAGELLDSGPRFHNECLRELRELHSSLRSEGRPPRVFLDGCMYDMTNRCLHRFRRARP